MAMNINKKLIYWVVSIIHSLNNWALVCTKEGPAVVDPDVLTTGFVRIHGKPGKSWNVMILFSRPGKS